MSDNKETYAEHLRAIAKKKRGSDVPSAFVTEVLNLCIKAAEQGFLHLNLQTLLDTNDKDFFLSRGFKVEVIGGVFLPSKTQISWE